MPDLPLDPPAIVVTASRSPDEAGQTPASVTLIDAARIERLGGPLIPDLLRLVPSVAVAVGGPAGSLTQVRIRGAEANHTLLFVDGIAANDPAAGNQPRFELLNADLASRIEVVRGPQSALWGSEAIGGVVGVSGPAPGSGGSQAFAEYGSAGTTRAAARTSFGDADRGISFGIAGQRSDGIDSFGGGGDLDGYRNLGLRGAGRYRLSPSLLLGASAFAYTGASQFDGYNPATYAHEDTLDQSRNRLAAGRVSAEAGSRDRRYALASVSLLGSSNRNLVDDHPVNRTRASRRTVGIEAGQKLGNHRLLIAADAERETFHARHAIDARSYDGSDQNQRRSRQSLTAEWQAKFGGIETDLAIRHDRFSRFRDATTLRGSLLAPLGGGFQLAATYGEGIARPTFFDLFGFSPGSFVGNPGVKPESSRGGEVSLRYAGSGVSAAVTYYRQRLKDEIVGTFDPATYLSSTANADGHSRRRGIEVETVWRPSDALRLTATYALLEASEPLVSGTLKEQRRPKHSGSVAIDGARGRFSYGAAIAYTGGRSDTNFDVYPANRVRLGAYWLATAQIGARIAGPVEGVVRIANAFDERYQDVVGYLTQGRSVHVGLRVALGS